MATRNWLFNGGANWTTAADWSGNAVPTSSDDVTVYQGNPFATAPISIRSLATANSTVDLENTGGTSQVSGNVTNAGTLRLDAFGGQGGSSLNVGGTLTNTGGTYIGNDTLNAPTSLTTAQVYNTGTIELRGSATKQASLVVNHATSFGTNATLTGTLRLFGNSLVSFTSGQITTLAANSYLRLAGSNAFVADAGSTSSNSALTGLTTVNRGAQLLLDQGANITTTRNVSNYGSLYLDYYGSEGGSSFNNSATINNLGLIQIGNDSLTANSTVTTSILNNKGTIELHGATSQASMVVNHSASFGTAGVLSGRVQLFNNSLISFTSGQINVLAAGSYLRLDGTNAFIADVGSSTSNSALTGLTTVNRGAQLLLDQGANITTTRNLSNYGSVYLDYYGGEGASSLSVGRLTNYGYLQIGNDGLTGSDTVTTGTLSNAASGSIELHGSVSNKATLAVASIASFGASGTLTGRLSLYGNSLVSFTSGQITTLASNSYLRLDGTRAFVADTGSTTSNSALTGLATIRGNAELLLTNGANVSVTKGLTNEGSLILDYYGGNSASTMNVAGTLNNLGYVQVGNGGQTASDSLTVGGLSSNGTIDIYGTSNNTTNYQASVIVNATAGTSAAGHLSGTVYLAGDALLQFASGQISTIDTNGFLRINGSMAFVADAGSTTSNSALTGLSENDGSLYIESGASIITTGDFSNYGDLRLDYYSSESGSSMTVNGAFDNENYLRVGNGSQTLADVLTAASLTNTGTIELYGNEHSNNVPSPVAASLIVNSAAGTGTAGELSGSIYLQDDALLQFSSGQINTIDAGASLRLNGADARVADAGNTTSNSALNLSETDGSFYLENGASVASSGNLANYGDLRLDNYSGESGTKLTVAGNFDNENYVRVGSGSQTLADILTAASLTNSGTIDLDGNGATASATISTSGAVANNGTINVSNDKQTFTGAVSGQGTFNLGSNSTLELDGSVASAQTVNFQGSDTLKLGNAKTFAASVSNFNIGDYLDLTTYAPTSAYSFAENAQGTAGVLTVGSGTNAAHINFNGNYTTASFTAANDGSGGMLIGHA